MAVFACTALVAALLSSPQDPDLARGFTGEPLWFVENVGQLDGEFRYAGRVGGLAVFAHDDGFTVRAADRAADAPGRHRGAVIRHTFEARSPDAALAAEHAGEGHVSFLRGADPSRWARALPTFGAVRNAGLYEGVDLVLKGDARQFEYDLVAMPGADLSAVVMRVEGADRLTVDADGGLCVETAYGVLRHGRPKTIVLGPDGSRSEVEARYEIVDGERVRFDADEVPAGSRLLLDPTIAWSTYLGGVADDHDCGCFVTDDCGCYLTGDTLSLDYPTTLGSFDTSYNGNVDAFVTNLIGNGTKLIWSTYLGGSTDDYGHGVVVDAAAKVYVAGGTGSNDFPATVGAYDTSWNGGHDIFAACLTADGTNLVYATYLGGAAEDGTHGGQAIALTPAGEAAIAGYSSSLNYPVTKGAPDTTQNDGGTNVDGIVSIVSADGGNLVFSTYLGGAGFDIASAIDVDLATNIVVTGGWSTSANFPVTAGAWATTPNGADNGFVVKLDATRKVAFSSLLGSTNEVVRDVACESNGAVLAAGFTPSASLPVTPGVFQPAIGGQHDGFVARFVSDGSVVSYLSYLGGSGEEAANGIDLDGVTGDAYIVGLTESTDFPVTPQGFDLTYNGNGDAFAARVSADGSKLRYATYLGGSQADVAYAAEAHAEGSLYVSGGTSSVDFPVTAGVVDPTANGGADVFITLLPAGETSCPNTASFATYGAGKAGQNGVPTLTALANPVVPSPTMSVRIANGAPNAPVYILLGTNANSYAFDGGTLLLDPVRIWFLGSLDASGQKDYSLFIPDNPNYCGKTMYLQVFLKDASVGTAYGLSMTNGLALTFGN